MCSLFILFITTALLSFFTEASGKPCQKLPVSYIQASGNFMGSLVPALNCVWINSSFLSSRCLLYWNLKESSHPFKTTKLLISRLSATIWASSWSILPETGMLELLQQLHHSHITPWFPVRNQFRFVCGPLWLSKDIRSDSFFCRIVWTCALPISNLSATFHKYLHLVGLCIFYGIDFVTFLHYNTFIALHISCLFES